MEINNYVCKYCNKEFEKDRSLKSHEVRCKNNPNAISVRLSDEIKLKISNGMKKAHKDGRACSWIRKSNHYAKSYAEQKFEEIIINEFDDKNYIAEFKCGKYWIDFAWPQKMIALEIDGKQHLDENAKIHDAEKDAFLKKNNWTVIRFLWSDFYNNTKYYIKNINDTINNIEIVLNFENFIKNSYVKKEKQKLIREELINEGRVGKSGKICKRVYSNEELLQMKNKIIESNIDLMSYGWVSKIVKKTGLTKKQIYFVVNKTDMKDICFLTKRFNTKV